MFFDRRTRSRAVNQSGAAAGLVLCGVGLNNQGLRLRIEQAQQRGNDGGITGGFVILDAGDNKHTAALAALVGRPTDAREVITALRREHPGCVSVANANILALERENAG